MSWNNIPNDERLRLWKKLREDIAQFSLEDQLSEIAKFFSNMPYGARTMDYYTPSEWLTPWEILYRGTFCKSSISLLIFYTFRLLHTGNIVELYLIDDNEDMYLVPVIDSRFVLNYQLGTVNNYSDVCNEFKIEQKYSEQQIKQIA